MLQMQPGDIVKPYVSTSIYQPFTITPAKESAYQRRIAVVTAGIFFEYLAAPPSDSAKEHSIPLLAIHKPGCVIGVGYQRGWPEDLRLDTSNGKVLLRERGSAEYAQELERQARSTTQSLRLNLKPVDARIVVGVYLLGLVGKAYTTAVGQVMGICRETVSRAVTRLAREGVLLKTNPTSPITLGDGALERYGLSTQELSDLIHEG